MSPRASNKRDSVLAAVQLRNRIQHGTNQPRDDEILSNIFADADDDRDFRSGSASNQARQDHHLAFFIEIMRLKHRQDTSWENLSDADVILLELSENSKEQVIENMRYYLRAEFAFTKPRSNYKERPRYSSIEKARDSLIYWISKKRTHDVPSRIELLNAANETLQRAGRQFGVDREPEAKLYFGRYELEDLIDRDTRQSPYLPVAESHHLAWCLALICGVRPGSIGKTHFYPDQYLTFRHIELLRGPRRGSFDARIEFIHLKGNRKSLETYHSLKFYVNGCTETSHLPMSVPHRLLIMLLRRDGLQVHKTLKSLLDGTEYRIQIDHAMLDLPVCRAAGPRGLSVVESALDANSMTEYLSSRAQQGGYPLGATMYCWRRKAATQWVQSQGLDRARQMMDHKPNSDTLIRHYDQGLYDAPVFEMAMGLDTTSAIADMRNASHEILYRADKKRKVDHTMVEQHVRALYEEDEVYKTAQAQGDIDSMQNRKRRARKLTNKSLHDAAVSHHNKELTIDELERRKLALNQPNELVLTIQQEVDRLLTTRGNMECVINDDTLDQEANATVPQLFSCHPSSASTNRHCEGHDRWFDAEDDIMQSDLSVVGQDILVGEQMTGNHQAPHVSSQVDFHFSTAVEVFMTRLGQDRFKKDDGNTMKCNLCIENAFLPQHIKDRVWPSTAKLEAHRQGREHSKQREVIIRLEWHRSQSSDKKYHCPYGDCERSYTGINKLIEHIKSSGPPSLTDSSLSNEERHRQQQHDDDKRADGWYQEDFKYDVKKNNPGLVREFVRRGLGLRYSSMKELPHPVKYTLASRGYDMIFGLHHFPMFENLAEKSAFVVTHGDDGLTAPWSLDTVRSQGAFGVVATGDDDRFPFNHAESYHKLAACHEIKLGNTKDVYKSLATYIDLSDAQAL